jgi:hypothetical protein
VNASLGALARTRSSALAKMRKAATAAAVASQLRTVARAYRSAARRIANRDASPELKPTSRAIADAMTRVGTAYARLAQAAAAKSYIRYATAQRRVRSAEQALNTALSSLRSLGFSVP